MPSRNSLQQQADIVYLEETIRKVERGEQLYLSAQSPDSPNRAIEVRFATKQEIVDGKFDLGSGARYFPDKEILLNPSLPNEKLVGHLVHDLTHHEQRVNGHLETFNEMKAKNPSLDANDFNIMMWRNEANATAMACEVTYELHKQGHDSAPFQAMQTGIYRQVALKYEAGRDNLQYLQDTEGQIPTKDDFIELRSEVANEWYAITVEGGASLASEYKQLQGIASYREAVGAEAKTPDQVREDAERQRKTQEIEQKKAEEAEQRLEEERSETQETSSPESSMRLTQQSVEQIDIRYGLEPESAGQIPVGVTVYEGNGCAVIVISELGEEGSLAENRAAIYQQVTKQLNLGHDNVSWVEHTPSQTLEDGTVSEEKFVNVYTTDPLVQKLNILTGANLNIHAFVTLHEERVEKSDLLEQVGHTRFETPLYIEFDLEISDESEQTQGRNR